MVKHIAEYSSYDVLVGKISGQHLLLECMMAEKRH